MIPLESMPDLPNPAPLTSDGRTDHSRVFLLSPANASAVRGKLLSNRKSQFGLAQRVQREGASLGEIFSFISSLYFRGKLAYAEAFSVPHRSFPAILIITASRGLLLPETIITSDELTEMSAVP